MISPDINILIYAHREESPYHSIAARHIIGLAESPSPFAVSSFVVSGFIRIVTNHRIFAEPTPLAQAIAFAESLCTLPHCRMIEAGPRHWTIFQTLLQESQATGNLISDAYLAAIVIEHGCELLTNDADFSKFPGLKIQKM